MLVATARHRQQGDRVPARSERMLHRFAVGADMEPQVDRIVEPACELGGHDPGGPADRSRRQQPVARLADHCYPHGVADLPLTPPIFHSSATVFVGSRLITE